MATVELLYFPGCPNLPAAREQLRRALDEIGRRSEWIERDVTAPDAPAHVRGHGSPTILVDGKDVTGAEPAGGSSCRVYLGSDVRGVPPLEVIKVALRPSGSASSPPTAGAGTDAGADAGSDAGANGAVAAIFPPGKTATLPAVHEPTAIPMAATSTVRVAVMGRCTSALGCRNPAS